MIKVAFQADYFHFYKVPLKNVGNLKRANISFSKWFKVMFLTTLKQFVKTMLIT